ncbi:hypothetical protein GY45DRAFT_366376 [Cubamyces sp. BRFM 1775]|nr:hypothetical protein GY45DRAFT_366376 [Cubamyces sp. BRFM 1775]
MISRIWRWCAHSGRGSRRTNEQVRSRLWPRADIYSLVRPAHCIPFICAHRALRPLIFLAPRELLPRALFSSRQHTRARLPRATPPAHSVPHAVTIIPPHSLGPRSPSRPARAHPFASSASDHSPRARLARPLSCSISTPPRSLARCRGPVGADAQARVFSGTKSLSATPQRVLSGSGYLAQRVGQCFPPQEACVPRRSPHRIMHKPVASRGARIKTSDPHRPR